MSRVRTTPVEAARRAFASLGIEIAVQYGDVFRLRCGADRLADVDAALHAAGCRVAELTPGRVTLEEFFMAETRKPDGGPHAA